MPVESKKNQKMLKVLKFSKPKVFWNKTFLKVLKFIKPKVFLNNFC